MSKDKLELQVNINFCMKIGKDASVKLSLLKMAEVEPAIK